MFNFLGLILASLFLLLSWNTSWLLALFGFFLIIGFFTSLEDIIMELF